MPESGTRVKICGIVRRQDVLLADRLGVDYLGVILSRGFSRSVGQADAADLVSGTRAQKVAVLVDETPDAAEERARTLGASVLQLHGEERPEVVEELRRRGPWAIWKAVRARAPEDLRRVGREFDGLVDGILVEGYKEGVVGGGGVRLTLTPEQVRVAIPTGVTFILSGGLVPESVAPMIRRFHPDVVDVSSGIESERGAKDPDAMRRFVEAARLVGRSGDMEIANEFEERG